MTWNQTNPIPTVIVNRHPRKDLSLISLRRKISKIFELLDLGRASVDLTLASDAVVRRQNRLHRNIDKTTDVLSFPQFDPNEDLSFYKNQFLGDILISLDRASVQARQQKISFEDEVLFLTLHSILHLLGFDHATKEEEEVMQAKESEIWIQLRRRAKR